MSDVLWNKKAVYYLGVKGGIPGFSSEDPPQSRKEFMHWTQHAKLTAVVWRVRAVQAGCVRVKQKPLMTFAIRKEFNWTIYQGNDCLHRGRTWIYNTTRKRGQKNKHPRNGGMHIYLLQNRYIYRKGVGLKVQVKHCLKFILTDRDKNRTLPLNYHDKQYIKLSDIKRIIWYCVYSKCGLLLLWLKVPCWFFDNPTKNWFTTFDLSSQAGLST